MTGNEFRCLVTITATEQGISSQNSCKGVLKLSQPSTKQQETQPGVVHDLGFHLEWSGGFYFNTNLCSTSLLFTVCALTTFSNLNVLVDNVK